MKKSPLIRQVLPLLSMCLAAGAVGFSYGYIPGLVALLVALVFTGLWIWLSFSRPLRQLVRQVQKVTTNEISKKPVLLSSASTEELATLGKTLTRLAKRLNKRIETTEMHSNEKDAILSSMSEGVIVVHKDERILLMNQEAQRILGVAELEGRPDMHEVLRIPQMVDFIHQALETQLASEDELEVFEGKTRYLRVTSRPLKVVSKKKGGGVVIVLSDVTRVRELEAHRQEFVTNVSHELRTPLTSIQGFAETLMSNDVDEQQRRHFLGIIQKHASRLNAIVEDILSLSSIEQDQSGGAIELERGSVYKVLESAAELCEVKAQKYKVRLNLTGAKDLDADINSPLLEQAVVNLIDNAIKYSHEGSEVDIECRGETDGVTIQVRDYGYGVPKKDLSRLFERFYRVDKARCRQNGGTGLGLSIVKHIALAHKGQVAVDSEVGQGSEFSIHLPKKFSPSNETLTHL